MYIEVYGDSKRQNVWIFSFFRGKVEVVPFFGDIEREISATKKRMGKENCSNSPPFSFLYRLLPNLNEQMRGH